MATINLLGGLLLIIIAYVSEYTTMIWLMFGYSIITAPNLGLSNSIVMINTTDSGKEFSGIRVWGTLGWIVAGLGLTLVRIVAADRQISIEGDALFIAGGLSIIAGLFSFSLPHTPPSGEGASPRSFLDAFKMLKNKNILIFFIISFFVSIAMQFYHVLTAMYLNSTQIGIPEANISAVMVIGQITEVAVMAWILPKYLPKYGFRKVMLVGFLVWPVRFLIYAIGAPTWLVISSIGLHGLGYVMIFTTAFIYIDEVAPKNIRHSAQSLTVLMTVGLGNYAGSLLAGGVQSFFTISGSVTNWTAVFSVPLYITVACAIAFFLLFKEESRETVLASIEK